MDQRSCSVFGGVGVGWDMLGGLGLIAWIRLGIGAFPGVRAISAVGIFRGRVHHMRGIDSLGGGINCVDWLARDCCIYRRAWDLAQWNRSLGPRGVRGSVVWMGSLDIMGGRSGVRRD